MKVTFFKTEGGTAFEVRGANGRLLATSPAFRRRPDALKALATLRENLTQATVEHKEEGN